MTYMMGKRKPKQFLAVPTRNTSLCTDAMGTTTNKSTTNRNINADGI